MPQRNGPKLIRDLLDADTLTVISVYCNRPVCLHSADVPLTAFLDRGATLDTPVFDLRRWCRCSKCGSTDVQTRSTPYPRGVLGVPNVD